MTFQKIPDIDDRDWVTSMELLNLAGFSYRRLDYWVRTGLLTPIEDPDGDRFTILSTSTPGSGYGRCFDNAQVQRAVYIIGLLQLGMSLQAIRLHLDELIDEGRIDIGPFTLIAREAS